MALNKPLDSERPLHILLVAVLIAIVIVISYHSCAWCCHHVPRDDQQFHTQPFVYDAPGAPFTTAVAGGHSSSANAPTVPATAILPHFDLVC